MGTRQKSNGKWWVVFLILLILVGGGGMAVWAKQVTDPITPVERRATISIQSGNVEVYEPGANAPRKAKDGEDITEGMRVVTGADGNATLLFYDNSVARLAPSTDIKIEKLEHSDNRPTEDKVGLSVTAGRVWSRVLNLLNLNAEFKLESSSTVATVRGTAFDFMVDEIDGERWTHVNGAESIVDCKTKKWDGILKKKEWLHVPDNADAAAKNLKVSDEGLKNLKAEGVVKGEPGAFRGIEKLDWYRNNVVSDKVFENSTTEKTKQHLSSIARPLSLPVIGSFMNFVAEKRIDRATSEEKSALMTSYLERQSALVTTLTSKGEAKRAAEIMDQMGRSMNSISGAEADRAEEVIKENLGRGLDPKFLNPEMVNKASDLIGRKNGAQGMLIRSVLLERKLKQLEAGGDRGQLKDILNAVNAMSPEAVKAGVGDSTQTFPVLDQRFKYLNEWRGELLPMLQNVEVPVKPIEPVAPVEVKTDATLQIGTPLKDTMINSLTPTATITDLAITPLKAQLEVGKSLTFKATALLSDATKKDVSGSGSWFIKETNLASLKSGSFTALAPGVAHVWFELNEKVSTTAAITIVKPAPKFSVLASPSNIQAGQSAKIQATLLYPDGRTEDVTASARCTVSGTALGSMAQIGLYVSQLQAGTDTIACSYLTTDGATLSAKISIVVEPLLSLMP